MLISARIFSSQFQSCLPQCLVRRRWTSRTSPPSRRTCPAWRCRSYTTRTGGPARPGSPRRDRLWAQKVRIEHDDYGPVVRHVIILQVGPRRAAARAPSVASVAAAALSSSSAAARPAARGLRRPRRRPCFRRAERRRR